MTGLIVNGLLGLMTGAALHILGLDRADAVRRPTRGMKKALLWAAGLTGVMVSLLMWLAVIDVDELPLVPLTGVTFMGGLLAGATLSLTGFTPLTALAGLGGGRFTESLCALAGCALALYLSPRVQPWIARAETWFPPVEETAFRVTLDKPFLLGGGFLAQGCLGLLAMALAVAVRGWLPRPEPPAPVEPEAAEPPAPEEPAEPVSIEPQDVREETIVVTLPGEEPVVVDTEEEGDEGSCCKTQQPR